MYLILVHISEKNILSIKLKKTNPNIFLGKLETFRLKKKVSLHINS